MTEIIETDSEFNDGISPSTKIMDIGRPDCVEALVKRHGEAIGAPQSAIDWGVKGAENALAGGRSASFAIGIGEKRIEDVMKINSSPVTSAWSWLQRVGVEGVQCTSSGVAGEVKIAGHWYTVEVRS